MPYGFKDFKCICCNCKGHPYIVHDQLWESIAGELKNEVMCIKCFEAKLGRHLVEDDFKLYCEYRSRKKVKIELPINWGHFGFHWKIYCELESAKEF